MIRCFVCLFSIIILFAACEETKIIDVKARIRFINASHNSGDVNLFVDYQKIYATDVQYLNYSKFREYITAKRKIEIKNAAGQLLVDTAITLAENKAYSLILYDSANQVRYRQIQEEFIPTGGSSCKIRFLHLSNDALSVNVTQDLDTTIHFRNYKNGDWSDYTIFPSGQHYFNVNGSNVNYIQGMTDLKAGSFYTMYLKGNTNSFNADSLGIFVIENNGNYD